MTAIPGSSAATGIHWPTAQATSIQNVVFLMSEANGTQHQGLFIESGSAGFMTDLIFYGGLYGANVGNQQYTMRNMTFYNCVTAINLLFDWGWTFKSINIYNCSTGVDMTSGGPTAQNVGSMTFFDSSMTNTAVGIKTSHDTTSQPPTAGSLILENVQLSNVPIAVQGPNGVALAGTTGTATIAGWGEGHEYVPNGPINFEGSFAPPQRPGSLLQGNQYYQRSKPQYQTTPVSQFLSARSAGATGNGVTDDTRALQNVIYQAAGQGKIVFVDAGTYKVTSTINIPLGSKIVGEAYPVIMSSGAYFASMNNAQPVIQVGYSGQNGYIEWSDMIIRFAVFLTHLLQDSNPTPAHKALNPAPHSSNTTSPPSGLPPVYGTCTPASVASLAPSCKSHNAPRRPPSPRPRRPSIVSASQLSCPCTSRGRRRICIWRTTGFGQRTTISMTRMTRRLRCIVAEGCMWRVRRGRFGCMHFLS